MLAQGGIDLEVIIVENGSTDGTRDFVEAIADPRVRVYCFDDALGQAGAINVGLHEVTGEWVGVLHDDDLWAPTKLQAQLDAAIEAERDWVFAGCVYTDRDGKVIGGKPPPSSAELQDGLIADNIVPGPLSNVIWRAGVLDGDGLLDEQLKFAFDWDLSLRLLRQGPPAVVNAPLVACRQHGGNQSSRFPSSQRHLMAEHPYLEQKFADLRRGKRINAFHTHRGIASEALRIGCRSQAFIHYTRAISGGDWGALIRMGGVFVPKAALGRLRRSVLGDRRWMRQAEPWLQELLSAPETELSPETRLA